MDNYIGRSSCSQDRFFPPITPSLYRFAEAGNPSQKTAAPSGLQSKGAPSEAVLELATRKFTPWQLWTGHGLDAPGQLGRLLWLHRSVLDDELNGRWKRADFYWRAIFKILSYMQKQGGVWERLNEQFGFDSSQGPNDFDGLRYRVISELLIDTCCALFNGGLHNSETIVSNDRAFAYAAHIQALLPLTGCGETERWFIAEPLADILVKAHRELGRFRQAIKICEDMAHDFPTRWKFQDLVAELETQRVLNEMHDECDDRTSLKDAGRLRNAIDALDRLRRTYPYSPITYERLGLLNQVRSVKLANGGKLFQALLAIEKAMAYAPELYQAIEIRKQLHTAWKSLTQQLAAVEAKIAITPGAILSGEGQRLKKEIEKGAERINRFIESGRAATISEAALRAKAVRLWHRIGLGGPDEQIAANSMKLYKVLPLLFDEGLKNSSELKARLIEVTRDIPGIDASMCESIERYLEHYIFNADTPEVETPGQKIEDPLVLKSLQTSEVPCKEPVGMWLFSGEALGAKLLFVFMVAAMVISGAMTGWDRYKGNIRDQAYADLIIADHSGKNEVVLQAAAAFLSAPGIKTDARREHVKELQEQARMATLRPKTVKAYTALIEAVRSKDIEQVKALSDRFIALTAETPNDPRRPHVRQLLEQARDITERTKRDKAYGHLVQAVSNQDSRAAIAAAEEFLALPQTYSRDPRTDQVKKILQEARELPNQRIRDAAFSDLLVAITKEDAEMVMTAAEAFLSAPPILIADNRREQVIEAYSSSFVSWFVAAAHPNDTTDQKRIKTYRDLMADNVKGGS